MTPRVHPLVVIALLATTTLAWVKGDASVYTRSAYGQSLTSSTLRWISIDGNNFDGVNLPKDIVDAGQEGTTQTFICRTHHSGVSLIGSTDGSSCNLVFFDAVHTYTLFEVLVNPGGAGRVVWKPWSRSTSIPTGTVENHGHYVARHSSHGNTYAGRLDPTNHRGKVYVAEDSTVMEYIQGEILVEVEAVQYEIVNLTAVWSKRKILSNSHVPLAETTLENLEDHSDSLVSTALAFETTHSVYLPVNDISGVNKILPAYLEFPDVTEPVRLTWGRPASATATKLVEVSHRLPYGAAVKVAVNGNHVTFQSPYTASMKTTYADGEILSRRIEGMAKQTTVMDIDATYGEPFFISNGSLVPTTTTTAPTSTTTLLTEDSTEDKTTRVTDSTFSEDSDQLDQPVEDSSSSSSSSSLSTATKRVKSTEAAWIQTSKSSSLAASVSLLFLTFLVVR